MYCENCGKQITEDSFFCEFCGHKIKENKTLSDSIIKTQEKNKKEAKIIIDPDLKEIATHLEFLGHKIEKIDLENNDNEFIIATHQDENNITIFKMHPGFILFKVSLSTEKEPSLKIDAFANEANKNLNIARFYNDVENNIAIIRLEAVFLGKYSKDLFNKFFTFFRNDQKRLYSIDSFSNLFLK